jgi:hypothetical protein
LQKLRVKEGFLASAPVLDTASRIGRMLSATRGDSELESEALLVFQDCATNDSYLSYVRALCFSSFRAPSRKAQRPARASLVPGSIRELADQLEQ